MAVESEPSNTPVRATHFCMIIVGKFSVQDADLDVLLKKIAARDFDSIAKLRCGVHEYLDISTHRVW
jgi:hypothetical protein